MSIASVAVRQLVSLTRTLLTDIALGPALTFLLEPCSSALHRLVRELSMASHTLRMQLLQKPSIDFSMLGHVFQTQIGSVTVPGLSTGLVELCWCS